MQLETLTPRIHLEALTGLRGIAAYSVLFAHALVESFQINGESLFAASGTRLAYFGMALFFVLSGFVIQYNYGPLFHAGRMGAATRWFIAARFARIYPLHVISVICFIWTVSWPTSKEDAWLFAAFATMTQSWFNKEIVIFVPDWSLSTEAFFYWAFIPLTLLVRRTASPAWTLLLFSVAVMAGLSILFFYFMDPVVALVGHLSWLNGRGSAGASDWATYFSPFTRVLEFICGMLAAQTYLSLRTKPRSPILVRLASACGLIWCGIVLILGGLISTTPIGRLLPNFIFAPALAPILIDCALERSRLSRLLSSRFLVFAGEISLSVYVFSFYVILMFNGRLVPGPVIYSLDINSVVKVCMVVGLTTVFAYGSYGLIEMPSRAWLLRVLRRREALRPA